MNPPALHFQQVVKRYGATTVLHGIDLEVRAGELFGLVGVNGAGKTSLIKCLLDFVALDGGSIEIFGASHRLPASRRALGFLPERFNPPDYLRGADFLKYMLKLQGLDWDPDAAGAMFDALDLDRGALRRMVRDYSKGMTQKLGLAACLLAHKDALVLDEPMSGLDPKARSLFKAQLQLLRARGGSVFFSSHVLSDVEQLCDRMAVLHQGRLLFVGAPADCIAARGAASLEQAFLGLID
jgi:ABC-2 type transport system ATP-binding protein